MGARFAWLRLHRADAIVRNEVKNKLHSAATSRVLPSNRGNRKRLQPGLVGRQVAGTILLVELRTEVSGDGSQNPVNRERALENARLRACVVQWHHQRVTHFGEVVNRLAGGSNAVEVGTRPQPDEHAILIRVGERDLVIDLRDRERIVQRVEDVILQRLMASNLNSGVIQRVPESVTYRAQAGGPIRSDCE